MKTDKLVDAIGMIKDEYIEEAHSARKKQKGFSFNWNTVGRVAAAAVCLLLAVTIIPPMFHSAKSTNMASEPSSESYYNSVYTSSYPVESPSSSSSSGNSSIGSDLYVPEEKEAKSEHSDSQSGTVQQSVQKLILTASLEMETQELDEITGTLRDAVKKYEGYVQNSSTYTGSRGRVYTAVIRIPAEAYEQFISEIEGTGNVVKYTENIDDVTDSYTDTEVKLASLRAQYDKVLEFYAKAESIDDLMSIENRLSQLQYEIESLEARLKNYDLLTAYSTLNISITETKTYTPPVKEGFFARLGRAFVNGWNSFTESVGDFIIDIAYNLWTILFLAALGFAGWKIYRMIRNRRKA